MTVRSAYRGRFAPSPTGPLHLGSLIAALASYLDARQQDGHWLVRMEDLDPPREQPGAADAILRSLEAHGLLWDEDVMFQSMRLDAYQGVLDTLQSRDLLFACDCSRARMGPGGHCAGPCRTRSRPTRGPSAMRIKVPASSVITFIDGHLGEQREALDVALPDFTLRRKDGLMAYQLAVVVDDAFQGINRVLRGADLLDSTARQIFLQQQLAYPTPHYTHIPVLTNAQGQKLSKQNQAPPLDDRQATANLRRALDFLGQAAPPPELERCETLLAFAIEHWQLAAVPPGSALYHPRSLQ